ncbi:hypothetical protein [Nocardioides pyridinolyticus]
MSAGPRLPRRAALALGAAGLVAVAGCDDGSEPPVPPPSPTPDADETLVDEVLAEITAVWRLTASRPELAAVHEAHISALEGEIDPAVVRRRVDAAVLRQREKQLRAALVSAALAAESGELARLLASMSAAVSQRLVVL